jgi:hypothetical protein
MSNELWACGLYEDLTTVDSIWKIFQLMLSRKTTYEKLYIVLDALDECEECSLRALLWNIRGCSNRAQARDLPKGQET